jgi:hypothetical protein
MRLSPGVCLGPYEIVAAIGAGGMDEVVDRLRRFELEARAASDGHRPS